MKKMLFLTLLVSAILMSCGTESGSSKSTESDVVITRKEINSEVIKTVANLSISGMTCSAGCGGKIQQDLQALKGVKETKLDYAENRGENVVTVDYNPNEINEQELIKCVNAIADGKYHVNSAEIVTYKGLQSSGGGKSSGVSVNDNFGKVFYVFDLLRSITKLTEYAR